MDRTDLIKLIGILAGSLLLLIVAAYFTYPYLNEEKHQEVVTMYRGTEFIDTDEGYIGREFEQLHEQLEASKQQRDSLVSMIDSLKLVNEELNKEIVEYSEASEIIQIAEGDGVNERNTAGARGEFAEEDFSERVKSLLNLDEGELAPIVNKMSNGQLVRLYRGGGNIQREKLLRSLEPERAAEIMNEIML